MSRTDKEGVLIRESVFAEANVYQTNVQQLAGGIVLTAKSPPVQMLDTNGVIRTVDMPSNSVKGQWFFIANMSAGAFALTIRDSTGATTICSIAQGKAALVVSSGNGTITGWRAALGT